MRTKHSAEYSIVADQPGVLAIVDADNGRRSITNDAAVVVRELMPNLSDKRLIYRDTDGRWDEILHAAGEFVGFKHIGADSLHAALCMVGGRV